MAHTHPTTEKRMKSSKSVDSSCQPPNLGALLNKLENTMDNQRLRNLTTKRLHTETSHTYQDLAELIGIQLPSTCILPQVNNAVTPWLKEHVTDPRFWEDKYDTTHIGEYELPTPTDDDRKAMRERLKETPCV